MTRKSNDLDPLLDTKQAAELLGLSPSWLAKSRMRGEGPPFIKVGERAVRYAKTVVLQWLKTRQRLSTSRF